MTTPQIYSDLEEIFEDVLDSSVELSPDTTAEDVEGWDSLGHIRLIIAIEKAFKVKFTAAEVSSLSNVGDLAALIEQHRDA